MQKVAGCNPKKSQQSPPLTFFVRLLLTLPVTFSRSPVTEQKKRLPFLLPHRPHGGYIHLTGVDTHLTHLGVA